MHFFLKNHCLDRYPVPFKCIIKPRTPAAEALIRDSVNQDGWDGFITFMNFFFFSNSHIVSKLNPQFWTLKETKKLLSRVIPLRRNFKFLFPSTSVVQSWPASSWWPVTVMHMAGHAWSWLSHTNMAQHIVRPPPFVHLEYFCQFWYRPSEISHMYSTLCCKCILCVYLSQTASKRVKELWASVTPADKCRGGVWMTKMLFLISRDVNFCTNY